MATSIRLSKEIELRLNHLALSTGRSKAFYLRELIENNLDEIEDTYLSKDDIKAHKEAIKELKNNETINGSKIREALGL